MSGMNHLTDPDEFKRFHELLTGERQGYTPWYLLLPKGLKDPAAGISWKQLEGRLTFDGALKKMRAGYNIGIAATRMDPLCIVDVDDIEATPDEVVKPTLCTRSRKRIGRHYFYFTNDPQCKENLPTEGKGEIRSNFEYAVAPGSFVPCDTKTMAAMPEDQREFAGWYTVENERPPATIIFGELPPVFLKQAAKNKEVKREAKKRREAKAKARKEKKPVQGGGKNKSAMWDMSIDDIMSIPDKPRFKSLFHESSTGKNTSLNSNGGLTCWRHLVTNTPLSALAVLAGVADCADAGQGFNGGKPSCIAYEDGRTQFRMWDYAKRNGMIPKDDPIPPKALAWYATNNGICKPDEVVDGWKLPAKAYNQAITLIEAEEKVSAGRKKIISAKDGRNVSPNDFLVGDESIPYGIEDGCFVKYEQVKDKHGEWSTKTNVLCNFTIDLTKDVYTDDDIAPRRIYTGDVVVNGSRFPFEEIAKKFVISSDFGRVLVSAAGSVAHFENRTLQDIRLAMQTLSKPIRKSVVATFGLADDHTYVTPSMIIDRDGIRRVENSNVDLSDSGNASNLDLDIISDEEFKTAGENIINHLLNIHNRYFVDCLIGHTFISPITSAILRSKHWSGERIGMIAVGKTGSGKTFTATRFQRFFGVFNSDKTITGWSSTPYSIQRTGYFFNDALFLIDDFKMGYFKGNRSKYASMVEVLQNYPDGRGRERLTADIQARKGYHIRGNVLITGEDLPPEASIVGRYHIVNVNERDKNRGEWRACFECQHLYRGFMGRFISWIIRQDGYADRVVDQINTWKSELIADRTTANIDRLAQSFMYNLAGFELFCDFVCESGFIDADRRATMVETHRNNLIGEIEGMATFIHSQTASELYLTTLRDLVSSGALKIHNWENTRVVRDPDYDPESEYGGNEYMEEELLIEEMWNCVGFDRSPDDPYIYIFPQVAYKAVVETLNRMDEPFSHSQNGTGKELIEDGHMKKGSSGNISQVWYQKKNRKVWALYKKSINYETVYPTQNHL